MPNTMIESAGKPKNSSRRVLVTLAIIGSAVCVLAGAAVTYLFVGRALLTPKTTIFFEPAAAAGATISPTDLDEEARVLSERYRAIGYGSPWTSFEATGDGQIKAQIPTSIGAEIIEELKAPGLVEFVDFGKTPLAIGTSVKTDYFGGTQLDSGVFHTILTGASIKDSFVSVDPSGKYEVNINLNEEGTKILADFTSQNIGNYLSIVVDKVVIWAPTITSTIPDGKAVINGQFTQEEARFYSAILKSGTLPIPLK